MGERRTDFRYILDYECNPIRCCKCGRKIQSGDADGFDSSHDRKNTSYCGACVIRLEPPSSKGNPCNV